MRRRARSVQNRFTQFQNKLLSYHKFEELKNSNEDDQAIDVNMTECSKDHKGNFSNLINETLPEFLLVGKVKAFVES